MRRLKMIELDLCAPEEEQEAKIEETIEEIVKNNEVMLRISMLDVTKTPIFKAILESLRDKP